MIDKNCERIRSYRDLEVWRRAMELARLCYEATAEFPKREVYGLASQIRRAAVSIPSNIAEGHSRRNRLAYLNHLSIALVSQSEVETQIDLSYLLGFIPNQSADELQSMAGEVGRMLHGLTASLDRQRS
jgi:four helix bundle protein